MKREYVYNKDGSVTHERVTFTGMEEKCVEVSKAVIEPVTSSPVELEQPVKSKRLNSKQESPASL